MTPTENAPPPRLTLRYLLRQIPERFFNVERGWLRTARELLTEPGAMIRRYVERDRPGYANPFSYLVMATAVTLAVHAVTGFRGRMLESFRQRTVESQAQYDFVNQVNELVFQNLLFVSFLILVPFAILLRWFFRRSGLNLAESFVFAFYTGGQVAFLGLSLVVLFLFLPMRAELIASLGMLIALSYDSYAAVGLYGGRIGTVVKVVSAYLLAYAFLMLVVVVATVAYVLGRGATPSEPWNLVRAAEDNVSVVARRLLDEGVDVDQTLRRTPLHAAADKGHAELVDLFLERGANVNARDHLGRVPMFLALAHGHLEIARRLAGAGTDPAVATDAGTTLLMLAVRRGDADLARWALAGGADVDAARADSRQASALMIAAARGDLAMVELLLASGADPGVANGDGETALDMARGRAVADRLRKASAEGKPEEG
ncbi:MAG TPA: ankyrin repeat domain-containing protein [Thermoanaerobaculia bacterium]|jgi:hypothetical protein